jgi:hypothetical protein
MFQTEVEGLNEIYKLRHVTIFSQWTVLQEMDQVT